MSQDKKGILDSLTTRTKVIGLVAIILESTYLATIKFLDPPKVFLALITNSIIFLVVITGSILLDFFEIRAKFKPDSEGLRASPLTPDSPLLDSIIKGAIHTVCRGVTVPKTPEEAKLRAFIFKKHGDALVCTHYWSPENLKVKEEVGLTFALNKELSNKVAVVKAYLDKRPARTSVSPLPEDIEGVSGKIDEDLNFVLAAPIYNKDVEKTIWGVVDFDTSNEIGRALLSSSISDNVMFHLAEHLRLIFSLTEPQYRS